MIEEIATRKLLIEFPGEKNIAIKKALSKIALARNGELKDAAKVIKLDSRAKDLEVKPVFGEERGVTVNGIYAFEQPKNRKGAFVGVYNNLTLPE